MRHFRSSFRREVHGRGILLAVLGEMLIQGQCVVRGTSHDGNLNVSRSNMSYGHLIHLRNVGVFVLIPRKDTETGCAFFLLIYLCRSSSSRE